MRILVLSFFLGLVFAGACTAGRVNRAEPGSPPPVQQSKSPGGQPAAKPEPLKGEDKARDDQAQAVVPLDKNAKAESSKESEPKSGEVEVVEEKYDNSVVRKRVEGKRNAEGEFVPHGLTSTWYESGLKWTETTFKDGIKHGPQRKWYNTGAEWSNSGYDNGVEHGLWTAYHPNGEKAREMRMDHGVWDGPYIEYHANGRKSMEVTFVKGLRQGLSTVYNEDGTVAFVTDYIDGVEQP